ncbi:heat shock protein 40 like protein/ DnaJ domain-containing protein [Tribonema minus]|uniref:Heat shock protein 40 like protein/ DnaJ domain-containing protein n=1 Tax=Tribonema minus TaxID=303371 RepID=A0A835YNL9_9STRA|nr:heat shock protein 40 like protein/ DnaJ domain-containing protein [Tribonema minus]
MADGDGSDGIVSLLFYVVLVYPACNWILTSKRFSRRRSIVYAILFLGVIAIAKVALEWKDRGPNHYQLLGVGRTASVGDIKQAYKRLSLELHPDKNPSPDAADQFTAVKDAYDVLTDVEFRDIYNKLGPEAIRTHQRLDDSQLMLQIAVQYIVWGVIAYMLTLGKSGESARSLVFTGEMVMLVFEVANIRKPQGASVLPPWFLPSMTEFELVWFMRAMFPAYMNGCRSICGYLHVDYDEQTRTLLRALQKGHNDVMLKVQLMTTETKDLLRELEQRLQESATVTAAEAPAKEPAAAGKGRSTLWLLLGAYVIYYYFFQS